MERKQFLDAFRQRFAGEANLYHAPGRVNLIGEHTDYNDGFVFPMALDRYTQIAVGRRNDRLIRLYSLNMEEAAEFSLDSGPQRRSHWSDYVAGVAVLLESAGHRLPGADLLIYSDVPVGSGLSSSAAIEVASALALLGVTGAHMDSLELARLCQKAENQFVGMNCGIMDQFISLHGKAGHALLLDCRSLDYRMVPLSVEAVRIVVCNTMVKHELGSSQYNIRRAQCEEGVDRLRAFHPGIRALRDVTLTDFERTASAIPEPVRSRCRHVISEDERVMASVDALEANDLAAFGRLMNASHDSLRTDYEVSCAELDLMVELARAARGCLGARMTGGGFGGCTVNLVEVQHVEQFCRRIREGYSARTTLMPQIFISIPSQGAGRVQ